MRSYADVTPLDQENLWAGYLPRAQVVLLVGDSGVGKGYAWCDLAARITRGDLMPDGTPAGAAGHVILISPEDDPSTSTVHRLTAAGADLSMVHDLTVTEGELWQADPDGYAALRAGITEVGGAPLVIIDPLGAVAVTGLTSEVPVRQKVMNPLQAICRDTGATILLVIHLTKAGTAASSRSRTAAKDGAGGSKGLTSAARHVLSITRDKTDPRIRTLDVVKSNLDKDEAKPIRYTIGGEGHATRISWLAQVDDIAEDSAASEAGEHALLGMLLLADRPADAQSLAVACGIEYSTARVLLRRLTVTGLVTEKRGRYSVALPDEAVAK